LKESDTQGERSEPSEDYAEPFCEADREPEMRAAHAHFTERLHKAIDKGEWVPAELLEIGLGDTPARTIWRSLVSVGTYLPGRGTIVEESYLKGVEEGREEGRAEERAQMVLRVLEKRRIFTLARTRERITACPDTDVLDRWLDRAFTITDAEDLFAED